MIVHRAQRPGIGVGGHISTYASAATLYEVGFNHFFRGKDHPGGGDQVFFQGHASPGMYARAFLEGRLSEDRLDGFRQEKSHVVDGSPLAMPVLPAPAPDARLLGVPHGVDGHRPDERHLPGAVQQVPPQPRHQGHQRPARVGVPRRRRDGRARVARPAAARGRRGARQPHLRHQLQPAAARRPGARQRQDHPGARGVLPRRRLERHQGRLGPGLGPAARRRRRRRPRAPDELHLRRRLPDLPRQRRQARAREVLRPRPPHPQDGGGLVRRATSGGSSSAAATTTARSTPPTRPPSSTPASRPSSSRRRSRATAWAPRSPGATRRTR